MMELERKLAGIARPLLQSKAVYWVALLGLCSAYLQGSLMKLFDFQSAIGEMDHFGLSPAPVFAVLVIAFELVASTMILAGIFRWLGALGLAGFTLMATFVALRFWEMPDGMDRMMATNAFFEHLGLAGAFIIVAGVDLSAPANR
ncbi:MULTISPECIES: DoxX family protein [unclassified Rhizobium]|uniref:DoxX family protein n=1 Tax=unclassified Rhizobium TaxID=2613769 RepID=UPI0006FDE935|nr:MULTISPECIES: DoxX family protein [unclassified Rhizobium]KQV37525.1 DoxX family protein [Rhizobium sp. Root1212]KRD30314.1 DoxX family protein [Rhizobium sp. Root268]